MDAPVAFLGRKHRVLFHDPLSASIIADQCYPNDQQAQEAAYLHILLDDTCSRDPIYKMQLEQIEILYRTSQPKKKAKPKKTKPKKRKPKKTTKAPKDPNITFLKKLEEARKLWQAVNS